MPLLSKHSIEIIIVDNSKTEKCDASCGVDWSSVEAIALAEKRIEERFGAGIRLKYLDLSSSVIEPDVLLWQQRIKDGNLPLPMLVINGEPRISGQFDIRMLLDAIDAEIELGI